MTDPLAASCARSFDGQLAFRVRPALLVVDVATAYVDPASPLHADAFVAAVPVIAG